ncbi:MAG: MotA/TolQ/ExbB proton channel family protein [Planctomycetales bacterium]|nr:MotA/TolQ/ExbB proton channel family protein [Planctomycetales bacterium]MCA9164195.1 MotA/TolQ/ExbB proton channel family protein [Planctomycetales bacterium]MCA9204102.1 MotA/TolQ/ExbB proton channel family protein [Planctomycetales bacterium]MCA9221666.1 MotA/TolQ/ExbB proton channel family protein [Planctomycetales bacterium]
MSLTEIYSANGWFFTTVFLSLSVISVYLIVWRQIKNMRAHTDVDVFTDTMQQQLQAGGPQAAFQWLKQTWEQNQDSVVPQVFMTMFEEGHRGKAATRDAMLDRIEMDLLPELQKKLPTILLFAKVAPMVGLLGTVSGMIGAFQAIASATKVNPGDLAEDIGMALFTTAEGLIIAIPLIFAYTIFRERVHRFEIELQRGSQAALKMLPQIHGQPVR